MSEVLQNLLDESPDQKSSANLKVKQGWKYLSMEKWHAEVLLVSHRVE